MNDTSIPASEYWLSFAARLLALQEGLDSSGAIYKEIDQRIIHALNQAQEAVVKHIETLNE